MHSKKLFTPFYLLLGVTLVVPYAAKSAAVSLNGTCEVDVCVNPTSIGDGQSASGSLNFTYTFGNGDTYGVTGTYAATYSKAAGSTISFDPVVTYLGATPSVGTDTLTLTMFQDYLDSSCCTWAGDYTETVPLNLSASAGPGSSISGEVLYDGQSVGLVGPFGPGSNSMSITTALDFGPLNSADTLAAQYKIYITFGQGTASGAGASSPAAPAVPEPAMIVPGGLCLLALVFAARRKNRSRLAL